MLDHRKEGKRQKESERRKMVRSESRRARCGGHEFNTPLRVEGAFLHGASECLRLPPRHAKQARVVSAGDGNVLLSAYAASEGT